MKARQSRHSIHTLESRSWIASSVTPSFAVSNRAGPFVSMSKDWPRTLPPKANRWREEEPRGALQIGERLGPLREEPGEFGAAGQLPFQHVHEGLIAAFARDWKAVRQREQQTSGRGVFVPLAFSPGEALWQPTPNFPSLAACGRRRRTARNRARSPTSGAKKCSI